MKIFEVNNLHSVSHIFAALDTQNRKKIKIIQIS